jgi:hypothetical protein
MDLIRANMHSLHNQRNKRAPEIKKSETEASKELRDSPAASVWASKASNPIYVVPLFQIPIPRSTAPSSSCLATLAVVESFEGADEAAIGAAGTAPLGAVVGGRYPLGD